MNKKINDNIFYKLLLILLVSLVMMGCEPSNSITEEKTNKDDNKVVENVSNINKEITSINLSEIPAYSGKAYYTVNGNKPFFTEKELSVTESYETYSDLDNLGRCGVAMANVGKDIMPTEERGSIADVKPTGWHTVKYNGIDGNYLYNRAHLIGFQLTGENANKKNLITGTRYLNVTGMLPFENMIADYVKETNNHVLYRVTPLFDGDNLLASGVLMEAQSVEDNGEGIQFNVYCYNVQPNIEIDYATGDSKGPEFTGSGSSNKDKNDKEDNKNESNKNDSNKNDNSSNKDEKVYTFVLNTNTKKYHVMGCSSIKQISPKNYKEFTGTIEEVEKMGYEPCKRCH